MEDDPSKASAATSPEQHCTSCDNTALPESLWLNTVADVPLHFPGHEASDRSIGFLRPSSYRLLVASQWEESSYDKQPISQNTNQIRLGLDRKEDPAALLPARSLAVLLLLLVRLAAAALRRRHRIFFRFPGGRRPTCQSDFAWGGKIALSLARLPVTRAQLQHPSLVATPEPGLLAPPPPPPPERCRSTHKRVPAC